MTTRGDGSRMTVGTILLVGLGLLGSNPLFGQQANRAEGSSESGVGKIRWLGVTEGLLQAKTSHKRILVDVYAKWCGWCKQMEEKVYGSKEVSDYITQKYVPIKLDGESKARVLFGGKEISEENLAELFQTKGYPTTVFLDSEGEFLVKLDGYLGKELFLKVLKYIGEDAFEQKSFGEYAGTSFPTSSELSSSRRGGADTTKAQIDTSRSPRKN